jgi:hypothetical protein
MPVEFPASLVPHSLIYNWFGMSGHQSGLLASRGAVPSFPHPPSVYCVSSYRSPNFYHKIVISLVMLQDFRNQPGNYMNHLIYHLNKYILPTQCARVLCDLQNEPLLFSCTGVTVFETEAQSVFCEVGAYFF